MSDVRRVVVAFAAAAACAVIVVSRTMLVQDGKGKIMILSKEQVT